MSHETIEIEVEILDLLDDLAVYVSVECIFDISRDGIGAYEFWGAPCFDSGEPRIDDMPGANIVGLVATDGDGADVAVDAEWACQLQSLFEDTNYLREHFPKDMEAAEEAALELYGEE